MMFRSFSPKQAILSGLLLVASPGRSADMPPLPVAAMIASADHVRNPGQPFRLRNTLTTFVKGAAKESLSLTVLAKLNRQTGQYQNLIAYVAPKRDAGKLVLLSGSQMWFFDPDSKASIRLSPQQRLLGQAASGDVVSVNLARDYRGTTATGANIVDADQKPRICWQLNLTASTSDAVYNHIEYWVEQGSYHPIKARYYSDSNRLLKTAYFTRYMQVMGAPRPTKIIILDGVNPVLVTTMALDDYAPVETPDSWFQRDYLPHFGRN